MIPSAGRFELYHCPEMHEEEASLLRLDVEGGETHERARDLSEQIFEVADEHRQAFEGRQRYRLLALERDTMEEIGVYVFALGLGSSLARSEPGEPTERGLLAQLMRHNQQLAQINVEQSQAVNAALIAENRDLRSRVESVDKQRSEWFELLETMHSERHEREIEVLREEARSESRSRALQLLARYVPEALKQIGSKGTTGAPSSSGGGQIPARSELEEAADKMRRVWRTLDREWIAGKLDEQNRERVDSLLGIGTPPKTMEEWTDKLRSLWVSLPEDVTETIQTTILSRDPSLAMELAGLMDSENEEAAE